MSVNCEERATRSQAAVKGTVFHRWALANGDDWLTFYRVENGYLLRFPNLADFEVSKDGHSVRGWAVPGASAAAFQHLLLNQVQPLALSRQGKLVLHASAVDVDGHGLAFVGASGRGKSTLAASFATGGSRFLTDDGLHLEWSECGCLIVPSHPSIRLWEDSQDALISASVTVAEPLNFTTKARLLAGTDIAFCNEKRPLRRIYYLTEKNVQTPVIEAMKSAAALVALANDSFLLDVREHESLALRFNDLSRLANLPIHYFLDYPRRYEDLPLVREAIARHANEKH